MAIKATDTISLVRVNDGTNGTNGKDGVGIKSIINYYLATASGSGVTASTAGWTTTVQSVTSSKKYLWNYEKITYTNNTTSQTPPCIIGAYGDKGNTGATGGQGVAGVGISSIAEYYQVSTSGTTVPTSWLTTVPSMSTTNKYLWNYELITYTNNTKRETLKRVIGVYGNTGAQGAQGVGYKSVMEYYQVSNSSTTAPTSWITTVPVMTATNRYLWNYEVITYTDNSTFTTLKRVIGVYGDKGNTGNTGATGGVGATGNGISTITNYYLTTASGSGVTTATAGWTTTPTATTTAKKYIWNYEVIKYTNGSSTTSTPCIIGTHGNTGATGAQGVGINTVDVQYYLSTSATALSGGAWSTTAPTWVNGKYMWSKTVTKLTNGTVKESTPACITGGKGNTGGTGPVGATGTGISSITEEYYLSTSKTTQSGGSWTTTPPIWSTGKYVWTRSKIVYTNPSSTKYTTPVCDSSWEAVNEIEIGGRNLLRKSGTPVITSNYNIQDYYFGTEVPQQEDEVTLTIKATLGAGKSYFGCYNSGGSVSPCAITPGEFKNGIAQKTFKWKVGTESNTFLRVYHMPSSTVVNSTIEWIRLDFGNKAPLVWTPAPEDIDDSIQDAEQRITTTYKAEIETKSKEIGLTVQSLTEKVGESSEEITGLKNQIKLTDQETSFIKTTINKLTDIVDGKMSSSEIQEWARFNGAQLELGASNSPFKTILSTTELAFYQGSTKVAWISNNELHIANSVIMSILRIGNWQWQDEGSAGLTLRKV